jgi:hypothetical protein
MIVSNLVKEEGPSHHREVAVVTDVSRQILEAQVLKNKIRGKILGRLKNSRRRNQLQGLLSLHLALDDSLINQIKMERRRGLRAGG